MSSLDKTLKLETGPFFEYNSGGFESIHMWVLNMYNVTKRDKYTVILYATSNDQNRH